jgi:eukaryotic-like serine/threonine-protein kinase
MNAERWQQLDQIFVEALQLPREARDGFVARACGADDMLRTDAVSLLASAGKSGEFMANPAFEQLTKAVAAEGWSLRPGERVGAYTVLRLLGSGGAGEVWQAKDERLCRDVAIKVLLPHFSGDAERLRRFAEEARTASALNHTNILTVYDVGEHQGMPFLVTEYLEGNSLRQRLNAGSLPMDEAMTVALGIARGLTVAHARGIIHRDLKPENVFIRADGGVKILDFGLAKLQLPIDGLPAAASHTMTGVILGTAGYMAPEQVRGEEVDTRGDLFALGVMLYEMLGGQRPFKGASTFETLHAILTTDPPDLLSGNPHMPPPLTQIVMRLLRKTPDARFQSAADLAWALEQIAHRPADLGTSTAQRQDTTTLRRSRWLAWIAAPALTASLLMGGWWLSPQARRAPGATQLMQFSWALPLGMVLDSAPVVSPDSQHVAFVWKDAAGSRLFVRDFASLEAVMLSGTEGAKQPFWSPDSKSVGFFARGKLMKVALTAGAPVVIADAIDGRGASWSSSGVIVFAPDLNASSLFKVSADGGRLEPATLLDLAHGENSHRWPVFLPDGIHFLYFVRAIADERRGVYLGRIDRAPAMPGAPLFNSESETVYVPSSGSARGDLLYVSNGRIEARSFDAEHLALIGDARTLDLQAGGQTPYNSSTLSASAGVLAFATSPMPFGLRLGSVDRDGDHLQLQESEAQNWVRLSPDGQRLARQRIDGVRGNPDIWVEDLARGTRVRVTTAVEPDILPVWSPEGKRLAYVTGNPPGRPGQRSLSIAAADGTGVLQTFPCPHGQDTYCEPTDWSPDGRLLIVNVRAVHGGEVWAVPTDGGSAQPLLVEAYTERDARVSPDGRWVSYVSDESGRPEVSVRSISGAARRIVVSGNGGDQPVWRRDGSELFFVDPQGQLRSVSVHGMADGASTFGLPVQLAVPPIGFGHWGTQYDVSPDGRRVYFMHRNEDQPPREIHVVIGWRSLLK